MGQNIDYDLINGKIGDLESLCDEFVKCYQATQEIIDDYCEGKVYDSYVTAVGNITDIMIASHKSIMGYITILKFAVEHYSTLDSDMTSYFEQ